MTVPYLLLSSLRKITANREHARFIWDLEIPDGLVSNAQTGDQSSFKYLVPNITRISARQLISVVSDNSTKMSLSTQVHHASYPYYDPALTDEQQDQIDDLLAPLIPTTTKEHPSLASLPVPPPPSAFWQQEYDRISQNKPLQGIDISKYHLSSDIKPNLVSTEYLWSRTDNLELLERYGSNAWLIGNAIQENALGVLEQELARLKEEGVQVNRERKGEQLELGGQIDKLEQRRRKALRGILEVEIAKVQLEQEIRELKRTKRQKK